MFSIILIMAAGIRIGALLRPRRLPMLGTFTNILIWTLLFLLGVEVGGDRRIMEGLASLGLEAVAIAVAGVTGCTVLSLILWRRVTSRKEKDRE